MPRQVPALAEAKLTEKRSRFFALVFPADSLDEAMNKVKVHRTKHRRARHVCWACRVPGPDGAIVEQMRDDGEVGHPGRILLELLQRRELAGGIVVARVFGGVKLGVGGVSRAFREVAQAALDAADRMQ
ncbi:MAG: YigZ family protein [Acidobacteria bacterium]|nr:YigZ family protein [Acidobacteriota bacterium]